MILAVYGASTMRANHPARGPRIIPPRWRGSGRSEVQSPELNDPVRGERRR